MSSVASFNSVGTAIKPADLTRFTGKQSNDEELQDESNALQGLFGMLFTVTKEREAPSYWFVALRLVLDFVQLFLLTFNPVYGWNVDPDNPAWKVFSFIGLNWPVAAIGYKPYLVLLYIMVAALVAVVALGAWVGRSFTLNSFEYVWPITFLRGYGNLFFQVLDVASMNLLLIALDCQYMPTEDGQQYTNQEFPDVACWSTPHVFHAAVAGCSMVVFVALAAVFQLAEIELNPLSKSTLAASHTAAELQGFLIRVLMTLTSTFLNSPNFAAISYLVCSVMLVYTYYKWIPHLTVWVNHVRIASYAVIAYTSILLVALVFGPKADREAWEAKITIALYAGLVPAGLLGAGLSWLRTRYFMVTVLNRFKYAEPGMKPYQIFRTTDAREIEILSRCCRVWSAVDDEVLDSEAVALAEVVIKHGLMMLPRDAHMIIIFSNFLMNVQNSNQSGYTQLQEAKRADPSFLSRFAIFSREQQHAQQQSSGIMGGDGSTVNLVSWVELKKNQKLVMRVHYEALQALKHFWTLLLRHEITLQSLTEAVHRIDQAVRQADRTYKVVLARHSSHPKIVRLYARFLEDVKQDPWNAAKWFTQAEHLEAAEEEAKNTNLFGELGIHPELAHNIEHLTGLLDMKGGIMGRHESQAMFIIDAQGIIQLASPNIQRMFGWAKQEVKGKPIAIIIPPALVEQHSQAIRNYVLHGKGSVVGTTSHSVALHRDRTVVPVNLQISKLSGIGEDILFLGLLEELQPQPCTASVWVFMGSEAVLVVDRTFTDCFGWQCDELAGAGLSAWLVDTAAMQQCFAQLRPVRVVKQMHHLRTLRKSIDRQHPPPSEAAQVSNVNVMVRHRWTGPMSTTAEVTTRKIGSIPFFQVSFNIPDVEPLIVADHAGRIVHITQEVKQTMSSTAGRRGANLAGGAPTLQALMPQPFSTLHMQSSYLSMKDKHLMQKASRQGLMPLYSCRAGLSVLFNSSSDVDGPPATVPFRIKMSRRVEPAAGTVIPGATDTVHVVQLQRTSLEQAFAERRMRLVLDHTGCVLDVLSGGVVGLFGFDPEILVGCTLGDFISNFKGQYGQHPSAPSDPIQRASSTSLTVDPHDHPGAPPSRRASVEVPGPAVSRRASVEVPGLPASRRASIAVNEVTEEDLDVMGGGGEHPSPAMQRALLIMAAKAYASPGVSWRVGVMAPHGEEDLAIVQRLQAELGMQAGASARPAIMSVTVCIGKGIQPMLTTSRSYKRPPQVPVMGTGLGSNVDGMNPEEQSKLNLLLGTSSTGLLYVLDIWRADLVMSVLELDTSGMISHSTGLPLYPAGLVFGFPAAHMLGKHISTFLSMPDPNPLFFFEPGGVVGGAALNRKRSNLKSAKQSKKVPGPVNLMTTLHQQDGGALDVEVQAVHKAGAPGMFLIVRPSQPVTGRRNLCSALERLKAAQAKPRVRPGRSARCSAAGEDLVRSASQALLLLPRQPELDPTLSLPSPAIRRLAHNSTSFNIPHLLAEDNPAPARLGQGNSPLLLDKVQGLGSFNQLPAGDDDPVGQPGPAGPGPEGDQAAGDSRRGVLVDKKPNAPPVKRASFFSSRLANKAQSRTEQWVMSTAGEDVARNGDPAQESMLAPWEPNLGNEQKDGEEEDDSTSSSMDQWPEAAPAGFLPLSAALSSTATASHHTNDKGQEAGINDARDSSKENSDLQEAPGLLDMQHATDYRRGQRFKKLWRLLSSEQVQQPVHRFRIGMYILMVLATALSVGFFVLQHSLLQEQNDGVHELYSVGIAARTIGTIMHSMREMDVLLTGRGLPTLPGLSDMSNMDERLLALQDLVEHAKELHAGVYLGFGKRRQLPNEFNLRTLWDQRTENETVFDDTWPNVTMRTQLASLWDAGNRYLKRAEEVRFNGVAFFTSTNNTTFWQWPNVRYIIKNGPELIIPGYYLTMEGFLQLATKQAHRIENIQLVVVITQGIVMTLFMSLVVWFLTQQVIHQQVQVYQVFIMVPVGLVRQLATRPILLLDSDEQEGGEALPADPVRATERQHHNEVDEEAFVPSASVKAGFNTGSTNKGTMRLNMAGFADPERADLPDDSTWLDRVKHALVGLVRPARVVAAGKRRLRTSRRLALWLCWPFVLCSVIVTIVNGVAYQQMLTGLSSSFGTFNIINFCVARYQRVFYFAQELCAETDPVLKEQIRDTLKLRYATYAYEYQAMLFGRQAVPNDPEPRFMLAGEGATATSGADILFFTRECLRANQTGCLAPGDPFYVATRNGLDKLMSAFADTVIGMYNTAAGPHPALNSTAFNFLWRTKPDMEGGLEKLTSIYHEHVLEVLQLATKLHVVGLVLALTCFALFFLFMLQPFLQRSKSDTRRVAELLSQLPAEVCVEDLVMYSLQLDKQGVSSLKLAHGTGSAVDLGIAQLQQQQQQQQPTA